MSRLLPLVPLLALLSVHTPAEAQDHPDAEAIVDRLVAAHGGLKAWRDAPSVRFTDHWTLPGGRQYSTRVVVEQGRRRSTLDMLGSEAHLGWDGEKAWSVAWESPAPPRFMAQLNYYFVNLPWLTQDPGVVLAYEGQRPVRGSDTAYHHVRMSFENGVGDTPDDYYLLYVDPDSHRLHGCEYIVTYQPLLPDGVEHTPPHDLIFQEWAQVDGLVVPVSYVIYEGDEIYAKCEIDEWEFEEPFDPSSVEMPEGAVVDDSLQ